MLGLPNLGLKPGYGGWSPLRLFAAGEAGAFYDPSDLSTLYQDSAATTPVTATGDPVGYLADKSGNGNHATQEAAGSRPTYRDAAGVRYLEHVTDFLTGIANPKWLHDGTGGYLAVACQAGIVVDPNVLMYIAGTRGNSVANGLTVGYDDRTASSHNDAVYTSIATKLSPRAEGAFVANTPHLVEVVVQAGTNGVKTYVDGVLATQATLSTPSALDCSFALDIGAGGNGDYPMTGFIHALLTVNRVPTAAERASILAYYT